MQNLVEIIKKQAKGNDTKDDDDVLDLAMSIIFKEFKPQGQTLLKPEDCDRFLVRLHSEMIANSSAGEVCCDTLETELAKARFADYFKGAKYQEIFRSYAKKKRLRPEDRATGNKKPGWDLRDFKETFTVDTMLGWVDDAAADFKAGKH
eukprot:CAMPEP_0197515196 /NCGR_PEP_ID=MMETSP1318-20131121/397_1 /TAXON_ID=552666 /ORGANISM="Partenskyella glossopodia, Strain RCC365" /LENGTH=148 /DNA_ID=CAMNT_0043063503 /DNA_START=147 /DNA_END=593 /DNA_ORIENTATION=+